MKIKCIIVDDEQPARDELRFLLSSFDDIEIIADVESVNKALPLLLNGGPDLLFLDIQMPGGSGFDLVTALGDRETLPFFVFVTAYDSYAVKAFEKSAIDYLLKPVSCKRLAVTIDRVRKMMVQGRPDRIEDKLESLLGQFGLPRSVVKVSVENNGRMQLLSPDEIVYCSCESGQIIIHTSQADFTLYSISTMEKLEEHLQGYSFFRVHRGVLVNLNCIREFSPWFNGKYNLIMDDDQNTELAVSRSRVTDFKKRLGI